MNLKREINGEAFRSTIMDCQICLNQSKKVVKCKFCDYETCPRCAETYLLERALNPTCMNCSKPWSRKALTKLLGKTFVNSKLKTARENELFEREKALFPETQSYVEDQNRAHELSISYKLSKHLTDVRKKLLSLKTELEKRHKKVNCDRVSASFKLDRLTDEITKMIDPIEVCREVKKRLTAKCANAECKGFVDAGDGACGMCNERTCRKCREVERADHACDPATVETVKLLKADTKPCPKCLVPIHKIDGCDQMFCGACHATFSWKTGALTNGPVHNPHYFEYLRRNGPGDGGCGEGIPHIFHVPTQKQKIEVLDFVRLLQHFEAVELPRYRENIPDNQELRIAYLENELDVASFRKTIQQRDKTHRRNSEYADVIDTLLAAGSDVTRNYIEDDSDDCLRAFSIAKSNLIQYVNDALLDISNVYNGSRLYVDVDQGRLNRG